MIDIQQDLFPEFESALSGERWDDIKRKVDEFAARYGRSELVRVYDAGFDKVRRLCNDMPTAHSSFDSQTIARLSHALGLLSHYTRPEEAKQHVARDDRNLRM